MSLAIFEPARKLFESAFQAAWGNTTPIKFENVKFSQPKNAPWVGVFVRFGVSEQASIGPVGRRLERHAGAIIIQCFSPKGSGTKGLNDLCDAAAVVFRMNSLIDQVNGIQIDLQTPRVIPAGEDKELMQANVSTDFLLDSLW